MMVGDIQKYIPTSTVGKVTDIRERDGKVWARLDFTGLYYEVSLLQSADVSEYKEVSYKEREKRSDSREGAKDVIEELRKLEEEIDIKDFTPTGGG